jgi:uncharacterized membrane protein YtjA (UPF0391 family)
LGHLLEIQLIGSACTARHPFYKTKNKTMLRYSLIFFIVAIVAALLGFSGIAAGAAGIAKILFYIFIVLFLISLVMGLLKKS